MQLKWCPNGKPRVVQPVTAREDTNNRAPLGGDSAALHIDWPDEEFAVIAGRNPVAIKVGLPGRVRIQQTDMEGELECLNLTRLRSFTVCTCGSPAEDCGVPNWLAVCIL